MQDCFVPLHEGTLSVQQHTLAGTNRLPLFTDTNIFHFLGYMIILQCFWRCWLGGRKGIRPVKNWVVGCWRGCLGWGADLHIAQQMPLPLTISCSSKSRLVLTFLVLPFWYLFTRVVPDIFQKSSKMVVCVCVCVGYMNLLNQTVWMTTLLTIQTTTTSTIWQLAGLCPGLPRWASTRKIKPGR